jgi:hypothetical protein
MFGVSEISSWFQEVSIPSLVQIGFSRFRATSNTSAQVPTISVLMRLL